MAFGAVSPLPLRAREVERFLVGRTARRCLGGAPEQFAQARVRGSLQGKTGQIAQELSGLCGEQNLPWRSVLQGERGGTAGLQRGQIGSSVNQDRGSRSCESIGFRQPTESPLEPPRSRNRGLNAGKSSHQESALRRRGDPVLSGNEVQRKADGRVVACPGQIAGLAGLTGSPQPD